MLEVVTPMLEVALLVPAELELTLEVWADELEIGIVPELLVTTPVVMVLLEMEVIVMVVL